MSFIKYKWQFHIPVHYNGYFCRLHGKAIIRVCGPAMSAYTNSVDKVDIFPRSSSTSGEGEVRVAVCLFGQRQLLVHHRHHLSTFSWLCVDISCKLYSQQLVKWRNARRSHDWQITSGEGSCNNYQIMTVSTRRRAVYTNATYRIPHADIQCAIDW